MAAPGTITHVLEVAAQLQSAATAHAAAVAAEASVVPPGHDDMPGAPAPS